MVLKAFDPFTFKLLTFTIAQILHQTQYTRTTIQPNAKMCRTLVEIKYILCRHLATWEIRSPDPNCNGILHRLVSNSTKVCKHCWVAQGLRKREWKRATLEPGFDGDWFQHRNVNQILYPIQEVDATPTSNCPTWQRRWPWNTRMWAVRQLALQRVSRATEIEIWEAMGAPSFVPHSWSIDADTKDCELLEVIPIEDLAPEDRECAICRAPFADSGPDGLCSGGGQVARRIPCPGQHVFGIDCITKAWKYSFDEHGRVECPSCRQTLFVIVFSQRNFRTRLERMATECHSKFLDAHRPIGPKYLVRDPQAISFLEYVLTSTSIVAALPMFVAVNHSMNIWGSKQGKLPFTQLAVVVVVGAILQCLWLLALVLSPLLFIFYPLGSRVRNLQPDPEI
jgi:hypothetical protein